MDKNYWTKYYDKHESPFEPSGFAQFCLGYLKDGGSLLELGCGNGRDSLFFAGKGIKTTGIEQCSNIVEKLAKYSNTNLRFESEDFTRLPKRDPKVNHVYSRFTLHSIDEQSEDRTLDWIAQNSTGYFFIEVRSDLDELVGKKTDHYRRFPNFEKLVMKLIKRGFTLNYAEISRGFAVYEAKFGVGYNEKDPMLIRIVCSVS